MLTVPAADSEGWERQSFIALISLTLKGVQGKDVMVHSMFPVAAGDRYKWPLLAVLSHAEQPNESAGGLKNPPAPSSDLPHVPGFLHPTLSLSTSVTQFKTRIPFLC